VSQSLNGSPAKGQAVARRIGFEGVARRPAGRRAHQSRCRRNESGRRTWGPPAAENRSSARDDAGV